MSKPKIRFKGCQGEWESKKLADCLEVSGEKNINEDFGRDDVLSVSDDYDVVNQIELLGRSYAGKSLTNYDVLRTGQIVYTKSPLRSKPYGIVKLNTGKPGIVSSLYAVYNAKPNMSADYLHWYFDPAWRLNAYIRPLVNKGAKNTMNISDETALTGHIYIPPTLPEQRQIAAYFRSLDGILSGCEARLSSLRRLKEGALQAFFPQQGETQPKIRFKGCKGEWERKKLSEIASFSKGHGYSKSDLKEDGSPIIMYGSMYTNYQFEISEVHSFVEQKKESVISKGNEVIIPASGETAEDIACASAILKRDIIIGGDLNILTLGNEFSPSFIALALSNGSSHKELVKSAQGKTIVHLHNTEIAKAVVFIPPTLTEQRQIAHFFRTLDRRIELERQRLEKLKQLKAACLEKMFV